MPGGSRDSWEIIAPIFRKIAAQVDGEPCCRYMGPDGAGHYVKMVHNGIEYGDMQLICEAYAILKDVLGLEAAELADIFAEWNRGDLDSYLIDITAQIFRKRDPDTGKAARRRHPRQGRPKRHRHLDAAIRDQAGGRHFHDQRRRGSARDFLAQRGARKRSQRSCRTRRSAKFEGDRAELIEAVRQALYASKIVSYAQGMELLGAASTSLQVEAEFRRHRHHLARRLHHSRGLPESHRRGLRTRPRLAQSAPRSVLHRHHRAHPAELAHCRRDRGASMAWRCRRSAPRSPTSTAIGRRVCPRTCCRRNAISLVRTLMSASISRAFFTPNGWNPAMNSAEKPAATEADLREGGE